DRNSAEAHMRRGTVPIATAFVVGCSLAIAQAQAPARPVVTIDQAVREALDRNLNLLAERFNVDVANAGVLTASLRPNPVARVNFMRPDQSLVDAGISPYDEVFRTDVLLERGAKRDRRSDLRR